MLSSASLGGTVEPIEATPHAPASSEREVLERQKAQLENQKLELEAEKLRSDLRPEGWWKKASSYVVTVGGALGIVVTLLGIWIDREKTRDEDTRSRFETAIKELQEQ